MFDRWLYSPRNYLIAILMVVAVYALALEELSYSMMGQLVTSNIVRIEIEETDRNSAKSEKTYTWNYYEYTDPARSGGGENRFQGAGYKVGEAVELQHIPGWKTWTRLATSRKPWLGWGILGASIVMFVIASILAKEFKDPYAKARAMRHRA